MTPEQQTRIARMTKAATTGTYDQWDKGDVLCLLEVLAEAQEGYAKAKATVETMTRANIENAKFNQSWHKKYERLEGEYVGALNTMAEIRENLRLEMEMHREDVARCQERVEALEAEGTNGAIADLAETNYNIGHKLDDHKKELERLRVERQQRAADVRELCEHVTQAMYYVSSESLLKKLDEAAGKVKEWTK